MRIYLIVSLLLLSLGLSAQITINTNFAVNSNQPIDTRDTLTTLADTANVDWESKGLLAFVYDVNEYWYQDTTGYWVKLEGGKIDSTYSRTDSMFVSETGVEFYLGPSETFVTQAIIDSIAAIGSGTANYIPKWVTDTTLGNSDILDKTLSTDIGVRFRYSKVADRESVIVGDTIPYGILTVTKPAGTSAPWVTGGDGSLLTIYNPDAANNNKLTFGVGSGGGLSNGYGGISLITTGGVVSRQFEFTGTGSILSSRSIDLRTNNLALQGHGNGLPGTYAMVRFATDNKVYVGPQYTNKTNAGLVLRSDSDSLAHTNAIIQFFTGAVERMRLSQTGFFGIGTTNPAYRLDMSGITNGAMRLPQTPTASLPIGANGLLTFDVTTGTYRAYSDGAYRHFVINDLTSGKFTNKYIPFANSSGYLTEYASFRLDPAANILYTPSNIYAYDNTGLGFFRINSTSSNYSEVYQNSVRGLIIDSRASGMAGLGNNGSTSPGFNVTNVVFGTRNGQGMAARFAVSPGSPTTMTGVGLGWISGSGSFFNNTPSSDTTIYANTWRSIAGVPSGEAPGYAISARRFQIYVGTGAGANSSGNYALKTIKYDFGFSTARIIPKTVIGSTTRFPRQALDVIGQVQIDTIEYEEDADYNIVSNTSGLLQKSSRAYAALKKTSTTTLTLGVTDIRVAGMTSGVSQNITLTDSTATLGVAGIYEISYSGSVSLSPGGSGTYLASFSLYQNSTELVETTSDFEIVAASAGNYYSPISGSTIMSLSASDVISLRYNGTTSTPSELRNISITIKKI